MTELNFTDREGVASWLRERNGEGSAMIAARAAVRMLPLLSRSSTNLSLREFAEWSGTVFGAISMAWTAARYPARASELEALQAAFRPARVVRLATTDDAWVAGMTHMAAYAARTAGAAGGDAAVIVSAAVDAVGAAVASAQVWGATLGADAWEAISADAQFADLNSSSAVLFNERLWLGEIPEWTSAATRGLQATLPEGQNWDVWFRWYDDRLAGRTHNEDYELAFATVPVEVWDQGAAAVNKWIKEHLPPEGLQGAGAVSGIAGFSNPKKGLQGAGANSGAGGMSNPTFGLQGVGAISGAEPLGRLPQGLRGAGAVGSAEGLPGQVDIPAPPDAAAIPNQSRNALRFDGADSGAIDLAPLGESGEHFRKGAGIAEDYAELLVKAEDVIDLGPNRLGRASRPLNRFASLPRNIDQVRVKLFWSRANTLRIIWQDHEEAIGARLQSAEPDERILDAIVASHLKDWVETLNVLIAGDASLMELDSVRIGPKEAEAAEREIQTLAPFVGEVSTNSDAAAQVAQEVLLDLLRDKPPLGPKLGIRQAIEFTARTFLNLVIEVVRRAYAATKFALGKVKGEIGFAGKGVREGIYRAGGAAIFVELVTRFAGPLHAIAMDAFHNPKLAEIIDWIARFGI